MGSNQRKILLTVGCIGVTVACAGVSASGSPEGGAASK